MLCTVLLSFKNMTIGFLLAHPPFPGQPRTALRPGLPCLPPNPGVSGAPSYARC